MADVTGGGGQVIPDPLARWPGESRAAHQALLDYAAMGGRRSLRTLLAEYVRRSSDERLTEKPPTAKWGTLSTWSMRHDWSERVAAYDECLAVAERAAREALLAEKRAAWVARHMEADEVLALLADQARGSMADFLRIERVMFHPRQPVPEPTEDDPKAVRWVEDPEPQERVFIGVDLEQARNRGVLHLVKKYTDDTDGMKLELYNAQAAQKLIGQHHKLFTDRHEHSGPNGAPIEVTDARSRLLDRLARRATDADEEGDPDISGGSG